VRRPLAALAAALAAVLDTTARAAPEDRPAPLVDLRDRATEYLGPGRDVPPPVGLADVRIAFFGPADAGHPEWSEAWRGATLAVEQANRESRGLPFRLLPAWSESPWGSGVADLVKLVYQQGVWGVLGGVDGVTTHLAEQVVVKARLSLVSPGDTDPSVNFTAVPWMFTLLPTDDRIAPLLAQALAPGEPWSAVTTTDRDAAAAWRALRMVRARQRAPAPMQHVALPPRAPGYREAVADLAGSGVRTVVVLAGPVDSAAIVVALRERGFEGRIVGSAAFGRRIFRERAGSAAEDAVFPLLFDAESAEAREFVRHYEERWGEPPDFLAAHAYDGARLLIAAVRRAGLNRALVRDALVALAPWPGATGLVTWDATGRNERAVTIGAWRGARACPIALRTPRRDAR